MKPESNQQPLPPANSQDDPQLWELLGRSTHAPAPDDFLSKVLSRVDELEAAGSAGGPGRLSLAQRWDRLVDALLGLGAYSGLRVAGALAIVAIVCGLALWPVLTSGPRGHTVQTTGDGARDDGGINITNIGTPPRDHFADAEMQTILRLDDYLAFADQQAFLDTSFLP